MIRRTKAAALIELGGGYLFGLFLGAGFATGVALICWILEGDPFP